MNFKMLLVAGALVCSSAACAHLGPEPGAGKNASTSRQHLLDDTPMPPADATRSELLKWKAANIQQGQYVEVLFDDQRALFYDPTRLQRLPDGHVVGYFRSELIRPRAAHGQMLRSDEKKLEIDCSAPRYRILAIRGFANSNMKDEVPLDPVSPDWTKPFPAGSPAAQALLQACARTKNQN